MTRSSIASGGSPPHATSWSRRLAGEDAAQPKDVLTLKVALQLRSRRGDRRRCENADEDEELVDKLHDVCLVRFWGGLTTPPKVSLYSSIGGRAPRRASSRRRMSGSAVAGLRCVCFGASDKLCPAAIFSRMRYAVRLDFRFCGRRTDTTRSEDASIVPEIM